MTDDLATALLPVLGRSAEARFNVFDVMHHGTHEKQISNVFRWLLDTGGTHRLEDRFLRIFIEEVNRRLAGEPVPAAPYLIRQEVNTSDAGDPGDIADLVLSNDDAVIVVENYFTSDGHGHSYDRYARFTDRAGQRVAVVLLCAEQDSSLQTDGWENASVVTYGALLERLRDEVTRDRRYQREHPEANAFIEQIHRKFVKGRGRVEDDQVLEFVSAMCRTGAAVRYGEKNQDSAAERFANEVAEQARERFEEGRDVLQRVKERLRNFGSEVLREQLDATLGDGHGFVARVGANYQGTYQWTVNFYVRDGAAGVTDAGGPEVQLKFGPSAWAANANDSTWQHKVDPKIADYSHIFLTRPSTKEIRQSGVTLREVLTGLPRSDRRLHDEIVQFLTNTS